MYYSASYINTFQQGLTEEQVNLILELFTDQVLVPSQAVVEDGEC